MKLVAVLRQVNVTLEQAELMGDAQWALAAQAAGVNAPSAETRLQVVNAIRRTAKPVIRKSIHGTWILVAKGYSRSFNSWANAMAAAATASPFPVGA